MVSVLSAVRDLGRLREISTVLARHGFGELVTRMGIGKKKRTDPPPAAASARPPAADVTTGDAADVLDLSTEDLERGERERAGVSTHERVRKVLEELGPTFIKLGQIASTRTDLLPPELILELKKLQDNVPPVSFEEIRVVVEQSLGLPLEERFVRFEETPLASASIGQVHRAVLRTEDGTEENVVVKVQRPGVGSIVHRDLELLHMLAAAVERAIPETRVYSPIGLVEHFDRSITNELNFLVEADNSIRFAENFAQSTTVRFPRIHRGASSKYVLTQEFFDGRKLDAALAEGADGKVIAKNAVGCVIKMIYGDGFFHADPHPGNVIILGERVRSDVEAAELGVLAFDFSNPVLGLIDTGMVGRLSPELRDRTVDLMIAAFRRDGYAMADALYALGRPSKKVDMREFRAEIALLAEKYVGKQLKELDLSLMTRELAQTAVKYGIEIPTDFLMVGKALMTVEGIGKDLDPDLDVMKEAEPYFLDLFKQRYSPERIGNDLWRGVEQISRAGYDVPMQLREVLEDARLGRLSVKTPDPDLAIAVDRLGRRVFAGLGIAVLVASGAHLIHTLNPYAIGGGVLLIGVAASAWTTHVGLEWVRQRWRKRREG